MREDGRIESDVVHGSVSTRAREMTLVFQASLSLSPYSCCRRFSNLRVKKKSWCRLGRKRMLCAAASASGLLKIGLTVSYLVWLWQVAGALVVALCM